MSAECERAFSAAGRMVTPLRNSLEAQTIGICQVLRSWYQAGIFQGEDSNILLLAPQDGVSDDKAGLHLLESDDEVYSEDSSVKDGEVLAPGSDSK